MEFRKGRTCLTEMKVTYDVSELVRKYGISRSDADIVKEYIRELDDFDETLVSFIISNVLDAVKKSELMIGHKMSLSEIQDIYEELPSYIKGEFGDKYLQGYMCFLFGERVI